MIQLNKMHKYLYLLLFLSCLGVTAQEVLTPLASNPAYRDFIESHFKDGNDILDLCNASVFEANIAETVLPTCAQSDGSITVAINSIDEDFTFFLNGDEVGTSTVPSYTFENLEAGPQLLKIVGSSGRNCELFTTLNNADTEDIISDLFVFYPAFCGRGLVEKKPRTGIPTYNVYNDQDSLVASFFLFTFDLFLEPGNYYIQEQGAGDSCKAYISFTIEQEPFNSLPFVEDFSTSLIYPDEQKWADRQAYVNRTFAKNPYTLGVATLDGLDENGFPYTVSNSLVDGSADTLTSQPFCINGLASSDSVYLSFLFQSSGIGDTPDLPDSLMVEIKDSKDNWHRLWITGGDDPDISTEDFTQVVLPIVDDTTFTEDQTFFYDGFQFRFRNYATITGLNDPWHIDYIKLDQNQSFAASNINNDFAHALDMLPLLKRYQAMPWEQFYEFQAKEFVDSLRFFFRVNDNDPNTNADLSYDIYELCNEIPIESNENALNVAGPINQINSQDLPLLGNTLPDLSVNKAEDENIIVRCDLVYQTDNDFNEQNDTLRYNQIFANYLAYDDGSAEGAYGMLGNGAQLAVQFDVNKPTVLKGIQIYFTHIVGDVSFNTFDIIAWDKIDNDNGFDIAREDSIVATRFNLTPLYTGEIGGFTTYLFDEEVMVQDTFYVGLRQDDADILNIGFDLNSLELDGFFLNEGDTLGNDTIFDFAHIYEKGKTFTNANGIWLEKIIPGAAMIRPILGPQDVWQTGLDELEGNQANVSIYPNPSDAYIQIQSNELPARYHTKVFDFSGKLLLSDNTSATQLNVKDFPAGMYFLQISDANGRILADKKFVKH